MLKRHGRIVALSQYDSALDGLVSTTPRLPCIARQYLNNFSQTFTQYERNENYNFQAEFLSEHSDWF